MKLESTTSDRGSVSLVYGCPACGYEFAMLANPMETQVVGSLGVKIEPEGKAAASRCPFTGLVHELGAAGEEAGGVAWTPGAEARLRDVPDLVRPMVRAGIERFARARGRAAVDEEILDEARAAAGLGAVPGTGPSA
jgi:hypothetical protein